MNKKYLPAMHSTKKTVTFRKTKGVDLADQGMCALVHPLLKELGLDLVFQSVSQSTICSTSLSSSKRLYFSEKERAHGRQCNLS